MKPYFKNQTQLLLKVLGITLSNPAYALKGGTAINFFHSNMPRLSVDIDLTYTRINTRDEFLDDNSRFFNQLEVELPRRHGCAVQIVKTNDGIPKQVIVSEGDTDIKIEANLVLRGTVYPVILAESCSKIEKDYGLKLKLHTLSVDDLFAGKFCAALDRQHPRDLFDLIIFFKDKSITKSLKKAFLVYLISGNRPIAELINPNRLDQRSTFESEFAGMTDIAVSYQELEDSREMLIAQLDTALDQNDRQFLLSFKSGNPDWDLLGLDHVQNMPAVRWKLMNIKKMAPEKHKESLKYLEEKLS